MSDTISRQAAIDVLFDFAGCIVDTPNGDYQKAYKAYRHKLETLPSAQPEPMWIPVEERLPREGQRVLVTDEDGGIDIALIIDYSDIGEGIEWWAHDYKCNPIAWSELPKPYERSEDE